jgi:hypothetical protein
LIKLLVAIGTLAGMALLLPGALSVLTIWKAEAGLVAVSRISAEVILLLSVFGFLASYWSASMIGNTVRAAIVSVIMIVIWPLVAALATNLAIRLTHPNPGFFANPHPAGFFDSGTRAVLFPIMLTLSALFLSYRSFRMVRVGPARFFANAALISTLIFTAVFFHIYISSSETGVSLGQPIQTPHHK